MTGRTFDRQQGGRQGRRRRTTSSAAVTSSPSSESSSTSPARDDVMAIGSILNDDPTGQDHQQPVRQRQLPIREPLPTVSNERGIDSLGQCSPLMPQRARRVSAASSGRRAARPSYSIEEAAFIWYHRDDLRLNWDAVTERYDQYGFPVPRGQAGLTCEYYRFRRSWNAPELRHVKARPRYHLQDPIYYGVVSLTNLRYP